MAKITARKLQKIYPNKVHAVRDFDLEIEDCSFVALVGPSGCGKSTFLRMIAGLEDITGGELLIGDRVVNALPPKARDVAMVFQSHALYPNKTVYENMALGLEMRRMPKAEIRRKITETAELLGITDLLDRKPGQMSGGQRQRCALGRAIVRNPSVFLLDEPLSNLDAKLRSQMRFEIIRLHKQLGTTFVYVTHDQVEAMTMADRIVVMDEGRILQADTPMHLYHHPANLFVAGFIGSPQMNLLDCTVEKVGENWVVRLDDLTLALPKNRFDDAVLRTAEGKPMVLGIRPEHISLDESGFETAVELAEQTGSEVVQVIGSRMVLYRASRTKPTIRLS